jgi:hypothetical protein
MLCSAVSTLTLRSKESGTWICPKLPLVTVKTSVSVDQNSGLGSVGDTGIDPNHGKDGSEMISTSCPLPCAGLVNNAGQYNYTGTETYLATTP